jgi:GTP-binding protein
VTYGGETAVGSRLLAASFVTSVYDHTKAPRDRRPAVAIAGRSNVGKSTLINSITEGKKIAKVSGTPGKTQALNFFLVDDRFYLVDLPGYGYAKVPADVKRSWASLVETYLTENQQLRGLVFLIDCRRDFQEDDRTLLQWVVSRELPFLIVMTKTDKLSRSQLSPAIGNISELIFGDRQAGNLIPFSAKTNLGRNEVIQWIRQVAAAPAKIGS